MSSPELQKHRGEMPKPGQASEWNFSSLFIRNLSADSGGVDKAITVSKDILFTSGQQIYEQPIQINQKMHASGVSYDSHMCRYEPADVLGP